MTITLASTVRLVDLADCEPSDYHDAVLWCPECAREPWHTERCDQGHTHRIADHGPFLDCLRCGTDLIWVVIEP